MRKQCETCIHKQVCSIKQDYDKFIEGISKIDVTTDFEATLNCKHHKSGYTINTIYVEPFKGIPIPQYPRPYIGDTLVTY